MASALAYRATASSSARSLALRRRWGWDVYAHTRSERSTPELRQDDSHCVPETRDAEGVIPSTRFPGSTAEDVNVVLSQDLDVLVLCLPLETATRHMVGREQLQIQEDRLVEHCSRLFVDTEALLEALKDDWLRGAALDATDPEPLPEGHSSWAAPNVFISPHISWQTPHYCRDQSSEVGRRGAINQWDDKEQYHD